MHHLHIFQALKRKIRLLAVGYLGKKYSTFAENIFANHTALQPVQKLTIYPVTKL